MIKVLLIVFVFLTITPASSQASDNLVIIPNLKTEILRGQTFKEEIFQTVKNFLKKNNRPKMSAATFAFLEKNAVLATPTAENPQALQSTEQNSILLIFLSKEDAKISQEWEEMFLVNRPVEFYPDIATIVIKTDAIASLNPTELAIAILQKSYEAFLFNENGRIIENGEAYVKNQEKVGDFLKEALPYASK